MLTALQLLNVLLPMGYLMAALAYLAVFVESQGWTKVWATRVALVVVGFHFLALVLGTVIYRHAPVANAWEGFSFIAFAMAVVYLILEWRSKEKASGVFVMVPVLLFQVLSSAFVTHTREVDEILRSPLFGVHVISALIGYVALSVGAVYGVLYVLLFRELKKQRVGLIFRRLPSLETLSRLNLGAVVAGWLALSVAIVLGSFWARDLVAAGWIQGSFLRDPKFFLTVSVWGLYGVGLLARYVFRWTNRQLAVLSVTAFILLLGSSAAVNLLIPSFHRFS